MNWRWGLWGLLSPSQLILGLLALRAILLLCRMPRVGRLASITGGLLLILFGLVPTAVFFSHPLETRFPRPALPERVDGIILVAGAERPYASGEYGEPPQRRAIPFVHSSCASVPSGQTGIHRWLSGASAGGDRRRIRRSGQEDTAFEWVDSGTAGIRGGIVRQLFASGQCQTTGCP